MFSKSSFLLSHQEKYLYEKHSNKTRKEKKQEIFSRMWDFFCSAAKFYLLLLLDNTISRLSFQLHRDKPRVLQVFCPEQNPASTLTFQLSYNGSLYQQRRTREQCSFLIVALVFISIAMKLAFNSLSFPKLFFYNFFGV